MARNDSSITHNWFRRK